MSNFVDDLTNLDYPKQANRPTPAGKEDFTCRAVDWNRLCQAVIDLRTAVLDLRTLTNDISISQLAAIATARILGRATAGTGDVEELTGTQVTAMLDSYTGSAKGLVPAGAGSTTKYLREDGAWATIAASATPSVNVSLSATSGGPYNLSTLGTVDWFIMKDYNNPPRNIAGENIHSKIRGGWIKNSFEWTFGAMSAIVWSNFQGGFGATMQTSIGDDTFKGLPYNSNLGYYIYTTGVAIPLSATSTGVGFSFRAPACSTPRTMVMLFGHFSSKVRITAQLADGSASHSAVSDSLASTQVATTATITYTSAYPTEIVVQADLFGNYTGDPNIGFGCAYVG